MHPLFARQLAKCTNASGQLDAAALGTLVSAAYSEADRDRERTNRSMSLMIEEVEKARVRLLDAFEVMPEGLALFDADNRYVLWNRRYAELHAGILDLTIGKRLEDVVGEAVAKGRYPEAIGREKDWLESRIHSHAQPEASREYRLANDRWLRVDERRTSDGGSIGVRIDITELKRREESFRLLFDANPIPMWIWDHETYRYLAVNDAAVAHYGYSREQFLQLTLFDLHLPEDYDALRQITRDRQAGQHGHRNWSHVKADGTVITSTAYAKFWKYQGRDASLVAAVDCTERLKAENDLKLTREFLNTIIESVPTPIIVKDVNELRYRLINKAAERYFGLERSAMLGKTTVEALPPESARLVNSLDKKALETEAPVADEHTILTPGSGIKQASTIRLPIRDENGTIKHLLIVIEDVTQKRTFELQLQQAQKMEAVGNLSGGIAHDFNNLLTIIIGNMDLLRGELEGSPEILKTLDKVLDASLRGATLTQQLLAFSRRQPLTTSSFDVGVLIENISTLMSRTLGENVVVQTKCAPDIWPIEADAHQLESAILNIAINARDAMPDGGKLSILTRNTHIDASQASSMELDAGDHVAIEISDTGSGIPEEAINRVFEPFFTTKSAGKGTGLGLSMVYGFVKQSRGHVAFESKSGVGTTFTLYFPRAAVNSTAQTPSQQFVKPVARSYQETILVVDDNVQVRTTAAAQLKRFGYRVLVADDAKAALRLLGSNEQIDLLFTDIVMPGDLNGKQLASEARKLRPHLKVLFTSGYPIVADEENADTALEFALISKPYRQRDLARAINSALSVTRLEVA
jgi:PAS domain S-box-containing protein